MNWKQWGIGALNALISGAAVAVGGGIAGTTFKQTAIMVGVAAVVSFFKWVAQHPLPGTPS